MYFCRQSVGITTGEARDVNSILTIRGGRNLVLLTFLCHDMYICFDLKLSVSPFAGIVQIQLFGPNA